MPTEVIETLNAISGSDNYSFWIYDRIKECLSDKRVLDVGSGIGNITKYFCNSSIKEVVLSDSSDEMLTQLKAIFSSLDNHRVVKLDISSTHSVLSLSAEPIEVITCINVLEHIKNDLAALKNMHKILCRNGTLVLMVPALPCLFGTLDELNRHYRRYAKKLLNEKLKRAGFVIKEEYYMNFFGITTWFLSGKILRQKKFSKHICGILDKCVPLLAKIEKYCRPFIGQSIVTICSKP